MKITDELLNKINVYCKSSDVRGKLAFTLGYLKHDVIHNEITAAELYELIFSLINEACD